MSTSGLYAQVMCCTRSCLVCTWLLRKGREKPKLEVERSYQSTNLSTAPRDPVSRDSYRQSSCQLRQGIVAGSQAGHTRKVCPVWEGWTGCEGRSLSSTRLWCRLQGCGVVAAVHLGTEDQGIGCAQVGCCGLAWHSHGKAQEPESAEFTRQDCAGADRAQVPTAGSHPRVTALRRNARLQIPTMSSKKRSMFSLVCALGTRREQQSTLWAAYLGGCRDDKPPLPAVSLVQPAGPLPCSATCLGKWLGSLGSRIKLGGMLARDGGPSVPTHPYNPKL